MIYGATSAGVIAAVQASRLGRSVIVLEPRKHVGGLTSGGLGATDIGNKDVIGGAKSRVLPSDCQALPER